MGFLRWVYIYKKILQIILKRSVIILSLDSPALGRQRQLNLYEIKANLVYLAEFQDNQSYIARPV